MKPIALVAAAAVLACVGGSASGQTAAEGSTVLIYKAEPYGDEAARVDLEHVVAVLKKRLDPNGTHNIMVRALDKDRVEIVLPSKSGAKKDETSEEVKHVKGLLTRSGILEFQILANEADDGEAIRAAMEWFANVKSDPTLKAEIDKAQVNGLPPPSLRKAPTAELKPFTVQLAGGKSTVTYSWVELSPQERKQLSLDNAAEKDDQRNAVWLRMAQARRDGGAVQLPLAPEAGGRKLLQGGLFYSRECKDQNLPKDEREQKKYEYFVLARNPEIDPATGKQTPKLDGSYLVAAFNQPDAAGKPVVAFTFSEQGGKLMGQLTKKNVPSGAEGAVVKRHLAIILDGQVMSAPTISTEVGKYGQISGNFTVREVDQIVNVLRAGALPNNVRLVLVSEMVAGPQKK